MFALLQPPPERLGISGQPYRLVRVFKHDFFAATCLYELESDPSGCHASVPARRPSLAAVSGGGGQGWPPPTKKVLPKLVIKFGREQGFCGLPLAWLGQWNRDHEEAIYARLAGVRGVPRWAGRVGRYGYAIEYIDGLPLDHFEHPPERFFEGLREIFDALHARGVAYGDANKRSNILVGPDGRPYLIDFQISIRTRDDLPLLGGAIRAVVRYLGRKDLYHLYKHKRRLAPAELTVEEEALSRDRGGLHLLHRKLAKPYRALRRRFLRKQYQKGQLISPTAEMEDHPQPEKETWRGK